MSGIVSQLQSLGRQDIDTTIGPSITFWKNDYSKHTNFALEPKAFEFQGTVGYSKESTCLFPRVGDLISRVWLNINLGNLNGGAGGWRFTDDVGRAILDSVRLELGNVQWDIIYPEFMHIWEELTCPHEKQLLQLTGKSESVAELVNWAKNTQSLWIPLQFYFTQSYGDALPMVALSLTDVRIKVKLRAKNQITIKVGGAQVDPGVNDAVINSMQIVAEVVYLDDPEREWFASTSQKYVITQHQFLGTLSALAGVTSLKADLVLNHPIKEYVFVFRQQSKTNNNANLWFDFTGQETGQYANEAFQSLGLKLNNNDRFVPQEPTYFRIVEPKYKHSRIPKKHIYVYSYALFPEDWNVSGSLNHSRIDSARMTFTFGAALPAATDLLLFARNINVGTIERGVALLRFSS